MMIEPLSRARTVQPLPTQSNQDATPIEFSLLSEVPGVYRAYLWENVSVVIWFGTVTLDCLLSYELACATCQKRCPNGVSGIHVVKRGRTLPDAETREALGRINEKYVSMVSALAIVIDGDGFWASAVRGLVTALNMRVFRPRKFERRVCANLEEVVSWLPAEHTRRTGVPVAPEPLLTALRELVSQV